MVRDRDGLPLMDWHLNARCDVLRITCPLETRLLVSGQHNATTRLVRDCTIAEVMEMVYSDKFTSTNRDDLHHRIKRALECSGVNVKGEKAVCVIFHSIVRTTFVFCHSGKQSGSGFHSVCWSCMVGRGQWML